MINSIFVVIFIIILPQLYYSSLTKNSAELLMIFLMMLFVTFGIYNFWLGYENKSISSSEHKSSQS